MDGFTVLFGLFYLVIALICLFGCVWGSGKATLLSILLSILFNRKATLVNQSRSTDIAFDSVDICRVVRDRERKSL